MDRPFGRPPAATQALGEWIALNERPRLRPARHPHRRFRAVARSPAGHHSPRRLALCPVHFELSGCGGPERVGELQEQEQRLEEAVKDLGPQLGRTEALAGDLKEQVELLRADYREIAEVLSRG